ncbi:hypothetical protein TOC8171_47790 [Pseudomonas syringae]
MTMPFLDRAEDPDGYPVWGFEVFYQQGISCFVWGLTKPLIRQAFKRVCADWRAKGQTVAMWQVRAFVYGLTGRCGDGVRSRMVSSEFQWPTPPDASWRLLVCVYPDGKCDLDLVHPVSRRFWSEDNGFFSLPSEDPCTINRDWFEQLGFEVMIMQPGMHVQIADRKAPRLKLV